MPDIRHRRVLLLYPLLHTGTAYIQAIRELINKRVKEENIYLISMFSTFYGNFFILFLDYHIPESF